MMQINWNDVETKWRQAWQESGQFEAEADDRPKMFITVAYPYPNSPQHVGHGRTYTIADIHARFYRMRGYNVLFPMGFHYTGTPIMGMAKRVEERDADLLDILRNIYHVPDEEIDTFSDPVKIARYFHSEIKAGMVEMGYSIDWRREFTTIDTAYQKFIEWHVNMLKEAGLIIQGSHPVGWCPKDQNPVSQHDTQGDVEPEFAEYIMIKFEWDGYVIPTATLRPETIFGVTNLWVNPDVTYKKATVDGEKWIISEECAYKMKFLGRSVNVEGEISGSQLVGRTAITPHSGVAIPMLEASFVDPGTGTGLVMSVPAHAPYDYQALADHARNNPDAKTIEPIPVITTGQYGSIPAQDVIEKAGITDQNDPRLEKISAEVYNKEFYGGTLLSNTGQFAGRRVEEAKDDIREWLESAGYGSILLELAGVVRCRCGAQCVVKIFSDQWFLNYADEAWKAKCSECIDKMEILPPEIRSEFHNVIEWLRERACARQRGMGTRVPWDPSWIVESLADSVIYMVYYIIAKYVNAGVIDGSALSRRFFDYVLLGKGSPDEIPGVDAVTSTDIRREFAYFYPVDSRHSGRDLVPNHLTFFVMNHVVTFPRIHWPRQIVVNGSVLMGGKKMSKSMGNIIPLRQAIRRYGADPIRLTMIISAELLQDAEFTFESVTGITRRLETLLDECSGLEPLNQDHRRFIHAEDRWIITRLDRTVSEVTGSVEEMRLREALHGILFSSESDLSWYIKRAVAKGRHNGSRATDPHCMGILHHVYSVRIRMLAPFAPHITEVMWQALGNNGTVSQAGWPVTSTESADDMAVLTEDTLRIITGDITNILKVTKIAPRQITIYTASTQKMSMYRRILGIVRSGKTSMGQVMKELLSDKKMQSAKRSPDFVQKSIKEILSQPEEIRRIRQEIDLDEKQVLGAELVSLASKEFGAEITIYSEDDADIYDPRAKARHARPFKPALLIE